VGCVDNDGCCPTGCSDSDCGSVDLASGNNTIQASIESTQVTQQNTSTIPQEIDVEPFDKKVGIPIAIWVVLAVIFIGGGGFAFYELKPKKGIAKLEAYIKDCENKGFDDLRIKNYLLSLGYDSKVVERSFKDLGKKI